MSAPCACEAPHPGRRIVLTGGPGAGKTAVLELIRKYFCKHVRVLPEAASILFGGGFPREESDAARKAAQRAIFHVQRQLELVAGVDGPAAITLCDRGTLDGLAYWPGPPDEMLAEVGGARATELAHYDAVIHLRTPSAALGYDHSNKLRTEPALIAAQLDHRIEESWRDHPRRFFVDSRQDFLVKAAEALRRLRDELPSCCRGHVIRSWTTHTPRRRHERIRLPNHHVPGRGRNGHRLEAPRLMGWPPRPSRLRPFQGAQTPAPA